MPHTAEDRLVYPMQDLDELLIQFTAGALARVDFEQHAYKFSTFERWNMDGPDPIFTRIEVAREKVEVLASAGLLQWPKGTAELEVSWFLQGPGENPDQNVPHSLGWALEFHRDCGAAIEALRACHTLDKPARLYWSWDIRNQLRKPTRGKVSL